MSIVYDIHTHDFPEAAGTAIVQLTPERYCFYPDHFYSVSLHPWDICDDWKVQMAKVAVMAMHPRVLAIGEAGLDKKKSPVPMEVQMEVFREHVKLSEMLRKPLIVHCVKAVDELLAIRKEMGVTHPWMLHGYRGGPEQAEQLRRAGVYVSLGLDYNTDTLLDMPFKYLLLESDTYGDVSVLYKLASEDMEAEESSVRSLVAKNITAFLKSHYDASFE